MRSDCIAVFGASGFVGSALCERLLLEGREFRAFIHSTGNAWRLTRHPIAVKVIDVCDPQEVTAALKDCSAVVNCTRGGARVMIQGLRTLLFAARKLKLQKFVHLSSLAIYGDNPAPDSVTEEGATGGAWLNSYGRLKLAQDQLVFKAHRAGLPSYILCPGNIGGPYSEYVLGLARKLLAGPFPLLEDGRNPTNIVHIDNVVQAIMAALDSGKGAGQRYFVNDPEPASWRLFCTSLAEQIGCQARFCEASYEAVLAQMRPGRGRAGLRDHVKILASGEFRNALGILPALAWLNTAAMNTFERLPQSLQNRARAKAQTAVHIGEDSDVNLSDPYLTVQLRRYYHSPARLGNVLAYNPAVDYGLGLDRTGKFLRFALCAPETFPALHQGAPDGAVPRAH